MRSRSLHLVLVAVLASGVCAGCASRVARPERTAGEWVDAVRDENWRRAWSLLAPEAREGQDFDTFRAYCEAHAELMRQQADAIAAALDAGDPAVTAALPLDAVRSVSFEWVDSRWYLAEDVPLRRGGDSPEEALRTLAVSLRSPEMEALFAAMNDDLRARYLAEMEFVADALIEGSGSALSVNGDSASVTVGSVTLNLVREDGSWRVSDIQQAVPTYYDPYYMDY